MNREEMIRRMKARRSAWDVVIIGGGASGLGAAVDAVSRGYETLLLEQDDFAKGTSSRSTKLVHGGVRYLAQGNISLVLEALRERGLLRQNATHLVRDQSFVIPCYAWWCIPFYTIGLTLYDLMAGKWAVGRSIPLSRKKTVQSLPTIKTRGLKGGVRYFDCQFDDARLAINLAQTVEDLGGTVINYQRVEGLMKDKGKVSGVIARDLESQELVEIPSRVVINATGVFVDRVIQMDEPEARDQVKPSQGIHLVMKHSFLKGEEALMVPKTSDGRVLFAVPWHNHVVVGTTDVEKHEALLEPVAEKAEVDYIIETAGRFMEQPPTRGDVLSVFTGLRPLAAPTAEGKKTKEISRGHKVLVSEGGLVTLTGGKWTTYRQMGEEVIDRAAKVGGLPGRRSQTRQLKVHGYLPRIDRSDSLYWYGSDRKELEQIQKEATGMDQVLSVELQINKAQVVFALRREMARTVEDFLARRTRALQLNARESIRMAPAVAAIMAEEQGKDSEWEKNQVTQFTALARNYILNSS